MFVVELETTTVDAFLAEARAATKKYQHNTLGTIKIVAAVASFQIATFLRKRVEGENLGRRKGAASCRAPEDLI